MPEKLNKAKMLHTTVLSIKTGNTEKGKHLLRQIVKTYPNNDMAWYWGKLLLIA